MLSCVICMVAYHRHPKFSPLRHLFIPIFGLLANLACMVFYLVGPFMGYGTKMEPLLALGIAAVWAIYGGIYFMSSSKATGRTTLVTSRARRRARDVIGQAGRRPLSLLRLGLPSGLQQ